MTTFLRSLAARLFFVLPVLAANYAFADATIAAPLEDGVAITDPNVLHLLENSGWDIGSVLGSNQKPGEVLPNSALLGLPIMHPFFEVMKLEFADYLKTHPDSGVGMRLASESLTRTTCDPLLLVSF